MADGDASAVKRAHGLLRVRCVVVIGLLGCGSLAAPDDGGPSPDASADVTTYDASWYDGGIAEPCHVFDTPCDQPSYILYGCCTDLQQCRDGTWQGVPDSSLPCH